MKKFLFSLVAIVMVCTFHSINASAKPALNGCGGRIGSEHTSVIMRCRCNYKKAIITQTGDEVIIVTCSVFGTASKTCDGVSDCVDE